MSITITHQNFTSSSDNTSYGGGITVVAGRFYIIFIEANCAAAIPSMTFTLANNTVTLLTSVEFNTIGSPTSKLWAYYCKAVTTATESATFSFATTITGFRGNAYEAQGCITTGVNGVDAITQYATNRADATADPSITLGTLHRRQNAIVTAFANDVGGTFGGTVETGWNLQINSGHDSGGFFSMYRIDTRDNTPTVTAAASDWAGIAVELKSSGWRRISMIN